MAVFFISPEGFPCCSSLASVSCGSVVTTLNPDGDFTAEGTGAIPSVLKTVWSSLKSMVKQAEITEDITGINEFDFAGYSGLTRLAIRANVEQIPAKYARNCSKLVTADLSGSAVKEIVTDSFGGCGELADVIFPENLQDSWYPAWLEKNTDGDYVPSAEFPFTDVPRDYPFYNEIKDMYTRGLMTGTTANIFEPETTLNRAFLASVLYRRAGSPEELVKACDEAELALAERNRICKMGKE